MSYIPLIIIKKTVVKNEAILLFCCFAGLSHFYFRCCDENWLNSESLCIAFVIHCDVFLIKALTGINLVRSFFSLWELNALYGFITPNSFSACVRLTCTKGGL